MLGLSTMSNKALTSKKARACPALDRTITPAECGAQRGSKIACTAECPFNPFGTASYDLYLKLDSAWVGKALQRVVDSLGREEFQKRLREQTLPIRNKDLELDFAAHNVLYLSLCFDRNAEGRTLGDQWEAEGLPGLNNDEQVMTRHRRATVPAVLEVQRVLGNDQAECIDLLAPETGSFLIYDRGVAEASARFTVVLSWLTRYPHYARTSGIALQLPPALWEQWRDRLNSRHEEARKEQPDLDFRTFLARNMVIAGDEAVRLQTEMNAPLQDGLMIHRSEFTLEAPLDEVQAAIEGAGDFREEKEDGEEAPEAGKILRFAWEPPATGSSDASADPHGQPVVRLTEGMLVADAGTPEARDAVKARLVEVLAGKASPREDSSIDLMEFLAAMRKEQNLVETAQEQIYGQAEAASGSGPSGAPGEVNSDGGADVAEELREHYTGLLDRQLESLDGRTPREAAGIPSLRPRLLAWGKQHVHTVDARAREMGLPLSIDWVLDELGLPELK